MENIKNHLKQAEKKLHLEWQEKEKLIVDDIERAQAEIIDLAVKSDFSAYSILDFENHPLDGICEMQNLPELVRIGTMNPKISDSEILDIPLLIPFSESAIAFVLNENDKYEINTLFELIALRLMLSLPSTLTKFYFADNNLGRDFALMNKVDKKIVNYSIIANQQERNKLFSDLEHLVSDVYKKHLSTFDSLKEYNKTAGEMQEPYHFVFITNFPSGFTTETAEKLHTLINNGNAAKAGVYMFLCIDKNEKPPFRIDIDQFLESTTCISLMSKDTNINNVNDDKIFDW